MEAVLKDKGSPGPTEETHKDEILSPAKLSWRRFKRDKMGMIGAAMVIMLIFAALFGNYFAPYDPLEMNYEDAFQTPSVRHFLGADRFGRDQLSRIIMGSRISMTVCFGSVGIATIIGIIIGLISGYFGGRIDSVIMRLLDVIFAFPSLLLALAAVAAFGPNLLNLLVIIGVIYSARFARIIRGSVLSVKEKDFIEGVRSVGAGDMSIMLRFILPNVWSPIIVQATFSLSHAIMTEAGLSFLGLGTQPPRPSWGLMLNEAREFVEMAPSLAVFPGLAIIFAVLAFNFLGDALRDAMDPRLSQR
ncbi:MAG: ABC transporter permease [Deltaproteobacteria bacterium]|nr:ABC transporter permease [Deltaproteobacteria bacterium]MBW2153796.1 ABC transporter permease [Deltaproteobacteria bacterium]